MAVKFRHKETGLFWCRAKGLAPSRKEYYELGEESICTLLNMNLIMGCTALKEFIPIGIKECLKTNTTLKGGITNLVHMVIY